MNDIDIHYFSYTDKTLFVIKYCHIPIDRVDIDNVKSAEKNATFPNKNLTPSIQNCQRIFPN